MANPKKPTHLKAVQGTRRKDRDNPAEPTANPGVASCPDWLSDRASELFSQLTATLLGMGIASPDDQAALAMLASRLEEVELMTAAIEDGGRVYEQIGEDGAVRMVRARPEVAMRNEAMRHAQSLLGEFGLTPAARSKVSAGQPAEVNPFKAFG